MAAPNNRVSSKFEFSNKNTLHSFDPNRKVYDNSNGGAPITLLELHLDLVRMANSKDVFIIDSRGFILDGNGNPTVTFHKPRSAPQRNNGNKRGDVRNKQYRSA